MCLFISLIPAAFFAALGFLVLFTTRKKKGGVRTFGRVLGIWLFVVAAVPLAAGAYATLTGICPVAGSAKTAS